MGNSENSPKNIKIYSVLDTKSHQWVQEASLGYCDLMKGSLSRISGEAYNLSVEDFNTELKVYQFRKDNPEHIVSVHSVEQLNQQYLCSNNQLIRVVTERIPFRLLDLGNIGYAEGLYILECSLKGAQLIDKSYLSAMKKSSQYIHYDENMVCFTEQGKTKIWLNQNIAQNHSQSRRFNPYKEVSLQNNQYEKEVVSEIMNMIESRMSGRKYREYADRKKNARLTSFEECLSFVQQMKMLEEPNDECRVKSIVLPSMLIESGNSQKQLKKTDSEIESISKSSASETSLINTINNISQRKSSSREKLAFPPKPPKKERSKSSKSSKSNKSVEKVPTPAPSSSKPNLTSSTQNGVPKIVILAVEEQKIPKQLLQQRMRRNQPSPDHNNPNLLNPNNYHSSEKNKQSVKALPNIKPVIPEAKSVEKQIRSPIRNVQYKPNAALIQLAPEDAKMEANRQKSQEKAKKQNLESQTAALKRPTVTFNGAPPVLMNSPRASSNANFGYFPIAERKEIIYSPKHFATPNKSVEEVIIRNKISTAFDKQTAFDKYAVPNKWLNSEQYSISNKQTSGKEIIVNKFASPDTFKYSSSDKEKYTVFNKYVAPKQPTDPQAAFSKEATLIKYHQASQQGGEKNENKYQKKHKQSTETSIKSEQTATAKVKFTFGLSTKIGNEQQQPRAELPATTEKNFNDLDRRVHNILNRELLADKLNVSSPT